MKNTFFLFLLISSLFSPLGAQVFVNANATGANDGTSWNDAYTDLSTAIDSSAIGSQIWVASARYAPGGDPNASFLINKQLELYGGFLGTESNLSERDILANPTILSGDNIGDDTPGDFLNQRLDNVNSVVRIGSAIDNTTIIDGFTISGGQADSISTDLLYTSGAGVFCEGAPLIRNCSITDNFAANLGAGMLVNNSDAGGIRMESCRFFANKTDQAGGGLMITGTGTTRSYIIDCAFENNISVRTGGGASIENASIEIHSSLFKDNTADLFGGGAILFTTDNDIKYFIDSCVFENNLSTLGGGLFIEPQASFVSNIIQNSRFSNNKAQLISPGFFPSGGGVQIFYDPVGSRDTSIIRACIFEGNEAESTGGGLYFVGLGVNTYSLVDSCTFQANTLTANPNLGSGSAYFNGNNPNYIAYRNSTFAENTNALGGTLSLFYNNLSGGEAIVQDCDFLDNSTNSFGSGLSVRAISSAINANVTIEDSYFEGNQISNPSFGQGGALTIASFINDFETRVNRCEFVDNVNQNAGAAIQLLESPSSPNLLGATALIQNSLFTGHDSGKAVIIADKFPTTLLSNNTIADNEIRGIIAQNGAIIRLRNNILSGADISEPNIQLGANGFIESLGGNLSNDSSGIGVLSTQDLAGVDPAFTYGPEDPYKISFLSPGVDLGVFYQGFLPSDTDVAGNPRFQGIGLDAGAYESPFFTSIEPIAEAASLSLYPIPVREQATIELDNPWQGTISLRVYNALGQQVQQTSLEKRSVQQSWTLDIRELPAGNYQLVLSHEAGNLSVSFIKQ
ncbi:MAG: T9SS type A sorting domain-containing protein [Bacteroidota bacterium]